MGSHGGTVFAINAAELREIELDGEILQTGIFKRPLKGTVAIGPEGVAGDHQAEAAHGGTDKAVYAYAIEDYRWWEAEFGREVPPASFGENLTVEGIDVTGARIGERWRAGSALLEVAEPRQPCVKLGHVMGDPRFVRRFARSLRLGAYLRVIEPGEVAAGDAVEAVERPDHEATVELMGRAVLGDRGALPVLLEAPALAPRWREWASARL